MANENQNTPGAQGPNQGSNQLRSTGKELLDSLKEQLRLEGDFRDILRDSVRELQKSIKQHDTIAAKLESYNNTTINTRQVQVEITKNLIEQNINQRKLSEYALKLGGAQSEQVKVANQYLKSLEERSSLEDSYLNKRSDFYTLENKLKETKQQEFDSVSKYLEKLEDQRKLEEYIASLYEKGISEEELIIEKRQLDILKDQISLKKQSFSTDQQLYLNSKNILTQANESVKEKEKEINAIQKGLNLEQAAYIQAKKTNELYDSNNEKLKSQEDFEKRSQKNAGVLGKLVGGLAEKFKVSEEVQAQMVLRQKELAASAIASGKKSGTFSDKFSVAKVGVKAIGRGVIDNFKTDPVFKYGAALGAVGLAYKGISAGMDMMGNAAAKTGNFLAGLSKHSGTIVRDLTSGVSDLARKIPLVGGLIGGLIDGFAAVLDLMLGVDDYAVKIGRQLNMDADAAGRWAMQTRKVSFANGDIFITQEKILESQAELATSFGIVNDLGGEIVAKNIKLKDFAGLELETRSKLAELTKISGKDATNSILAQVKGLQRSTGIAFQYQAILKEAASQSGYLGLQFSKFPAQMTKTLLTVKAMGMELKQVEAIGDSLLDFESSISKEFEAQLLTGKEINLAKAREAFLNNDLATAAAEITKQVGSTEDFLKLNRIQAESLASAFGMSRDQMGDMLRQQELLAKLGAKQGDNAREQLRLGLEKYGNEKALAEAIGEQAYQSMVNASTQEKLAATIEKIKESIVSFVMESGLFEKVKEFMEYLTRPGTIKGILGTIRDAISTFIEVVGEILADIIEVGGEIANFFTVGRKGDERERKAYELGAKVREGSKAFSERVKSYGGGQQAPAPIEDKAAKEKTASTPNTKSNDENVMKPPVVNVYNTNNMEIKPVDGKAISETVTKTVYGDNTPGQLK